MNLGVSDLIAFGPGKKLLTIIIPLFLILSLPFSLGIDILSIGRMLGAAICPRAHLSGDRNVSGIAVVPVLTPIFARNIAFHHIDCGNVVLVVGTAISQFHTCSSLFGSKKAVWSDVIFHGKFFEFLYSILPFIEKNG
jgi:hypothetical protein